MFQNDAHAIQTTEIRTGFQEAIWGIYHIVQRDQKCFEDGLHVHVHSFTKLYGKINAQSIKPFSPHSNEKTNKIQIEKKKNIDIED